MPEVLTVTDRDVRSLYLDLIRRDLTRYGMDERVPVWWPLRDAPPQIQQHRSTPMLLRISPFGQRKRDLGLDWPAEAETMIGMQRLTSLQHCVETVLADDIPGDLVECGVWRGGACILMRAVLAAYGDETRCVWLADSFAGVPRPDTAKYKADKWMLTSRRAYWGCRKRKSGRISSATGCWMTRSAFFLAGSKTRCTMPRLIASLY